MVPKTAKATHPEPRGQRCSPTLFYVILAALVLLMGAFIALKPARDRDVKKVPAARVDLSKPTE